MDIKILIVGILSIIKKPYSPYSSIMWKQFKIFIQLRILSQMFRAVVTSILLKKKNPYN